ncbi:MAG TPA: dynamin family protein [Streptosporangiaceae bacterium]|nr:dynamin family protein [Streptosporangiaceae bacterium]
MRPPAEPAETTASPEVTAAPEPADVPVTAAEEAAPPPDSPAEDSPAEPHIRLNAQALEGALVNLRKRIAAVPLLFETPDLAEVRAERAKLLSQVDDYLLPRLRRSTAPILVAVVGSTGAGKSTLVNSIVGQPVSATGVRRPTTNSPVLACHPDDADWFAENNFLPSLPRVRQEGLARPGRDGLLVLASTEGMPRGLALLDTPDIDSVQEAHHQFAYQFLDASDLWLFVTSASRYADAPVWQVLQHARDRGASLGVVLSRVPSGARAELVAHFSAMLDANGIEAADRFVIPETRPAGGMLPPEAFEPIRAYLTDTSRREERRMAVLTQTMAGVLDTFHTRVPALAAAAEAQLAVRNRLRKQAEDPYRAALGTVEKAFRDGELLRGEVQARWQDLVVTGDLTRTLRTRKPPRQGKRARKRQAPERSTALATALRSALEAVIVTAADRAAEEAERQWRDDPAGSVMLTVAAEELATGHRADRLFATVFGDGTGAGAEELNLEKSSADLPDRVSRAISAWQDHVLRLVRQAVKQKRGHGRPAGLDDDTLTLVTVLAILGQGAIGSHAATTSDDSDILTLPRRVAAAVLGEEPVQEIFGIARVELNERARLLLDEELLRFPEVIDGVGRCDEVAGVRLYQAGFMLEALQ